jgi:hypothetical protein
MKSLNNQIDKQALLARLRQLTPNSRRRWGKMTAHQMICHLDDSFKSVIGEREVSLVKRNALTRNVVRWIALYAPFKWPHGVPTRPENDQQQGGTPPEDFKLDVEALVSMIERVSGNARADFEWQRHPLFDEMSERDWLRWGYLHVDHHLRQFGV